MLWLVSDRLFVTAEKARLKGAFGQFVYKMIILCSAIVSLQAQLQLQ